MQEIQIDDNLVKKEFTKSTEQFHIITTWIGLLLNIIWCISDYFVLPEKFLPFFIFRLSVSLITTLAILSKKITGLSIYTIMFILVLGISIQNAFMWSVMDLANLQKHAFAYMVLFIGVGMLVLWEIWYSVIIVVVTIICNVVFYLLNSKLSVDEFTINGGLLVLTVAIFCIFLIRTRYRLTINEIRIRLQLEKSNQIIEQEHALVLEQKVEISQQKDILEHKNKEITDSINYAKRIQSAIIPVESRFNAFFKESFVLFKPKDIVSGDFYWIIEHNSFIYYVTADCTGHGVPGGFMTMMGISFIEDIIENNHDVDAAEILNILRDKIITTMRQTTIGQENKDGMDVTLCKVNLSTLEMNYAAANNSFFIIRDNKLLEFKADKQPCGYFPEPKPFTSHTIKLQKDDFIYTFTDGYADQFGGPKGKKFLYKQFEELLMKNHKLPADFQKNELSNAIVNWMGKEEQVDDILVIGVKI
ncbi:MAG: SpoIIE family protein phosphatase [Bacteroidota bacterium]|nr:SpoIIE family protein phosphatase [Bacteroidota bacterium]